MRQFELSPTPRACFAVDKASDDLFRTRHTRRSDQRQSRTACGNRAVKTATDHSASTGQTPRLPEHRPDSAGAPGHVGSDTETNALPGPACDATTLAWGSFPDILGTQIAAACQKAEAFA